ncbi:MAG: hypothetical protein RL266_2091 [Bacteroidota bacterium]|jgi:class 3 adenylate cyclase
MPLFMLWFHRKFLVFTIVLFSLVDGLAQERTAIGHLVQDALHERKQGNYKVSSLLLDSALVIAKNLNDLEAIGEIQTAQGVVKMYQSNYADALRNFQNGLAIRQELNDSSLLAESYNYIAAVHHSQSNLTTAAKYYEYALALTEGRGTRRETGVLYNNLGSLHEDLKEFDVALDYHQQSMRIWESIPDSSWIQIALIHQGMCYQEQGNIPKAMELFTKSYELSQKLGNRIQVMYASLSLGLIHKDLKAYQDALSWCSLSYDLSIEDRNYEFQQRAADCLAEVYESLKDPLRALQYYKLASQIQDSVFSQEKTKELTQLEMNYQFERQQLADSLEFLTTSLKQEKKISNQRIGMVAIGCTTFLILLLALVVYFGKRKSDALLLNILPAEVAEELKETGTSKARRLENVTVLFTDFKGFTSMSEVLSPEELVAEIHYCFSAFDAILGKYQVEKVKTIGDAYMAAGGIPTPKIDNAKDVVRAAIEIRDFMKQRAEELAAKGKQAFEMRIGIHTGTVVAGIVGTKKFQYDIWGDAVNTAARMESSGMEGMINVSQSTYEIIQKDFHCISRGKIKAKGKGEMEMYFVELKELSF